MVFFHWLLYQLQPGTGHLTHHTLTISMIVLFFSSILSGFIPFINIEAILVPISWHYKNVPIFLIALIATIGQMVAKITLFYLSKKGSKIYLRR